MKGLSSFEHVLEERIDQATALELLEKADLTTLGYLADQVRRRFHPENIATFVIDRNVNWLCFRHGGNFKESARAGRLGWDYSTYAGRTKSKPPP
jgi:hypothetical protein